MRFELPVLFAPRLCEIERIVLSPDDDGQLRRTILKRRQIDGERRIAAFVSAGGVTVAPDARRVIDGPEMQEQPRAGRQSRLSEGAAVPARAEEAGLVDAAGRGFRCERHDDLRLPGHFTRVAPYRVAIERKVPGAVQRLPAVTVELRPRVAACGLILGRVVHRQSGLAPLGSQAGRGYRCVLARVTLSSKSGSMS